MNTTNHEYMSHVTYHWKLYPYNNLTQPTPCPLTDATNHVRTHAMLCEIAVADAPMQPYNAKNRKKSAIPDRRFVRRIPRMPAYGFFDSHFSRFGGSFRNGQTSVLGLSFLSGWRSPVSLTGLLVIQCTRACLVMTSEGKCTALLG
jgi:hypothetical protein